MTLRPPRTAARSGRTLLLAGNTLHARDEQGRYCTHSALARQLDQWFAEFDHIVIAAVLDTNGAVPAGFAPYAPADITFVPLRKAGGTGLAAKLDALWSSLAWVRALVPLLRRADVVHLRAPCNITLVAIPLARVLSPKRYAIYAGAWDPPPGGPRSYTLQRWMLRHFGGVVHVYAPASSASAPNLRPNFSPTFTAAQLDELALAARRRLARIEVRPPADTGMRVCCVGRFSTNKNQAAVVEAAAILAGQGVHLDLRFAGAGGTEEEVRALVAEHKLTRSVSFLGRCDEAEVKALYEWADVNVMISEVEGFGRVILEGMAAGCPAVCGPGVMQQTMVGVDGARGRQVDPPDAVGLVVALADLRSMSHAAWISTAEACRSYVRTHTVDAFGEEVRGLLHMLDPEAYSGRGREDDAG